MKAEIEKSKLNIEGSTQEFKTDISSLYKPPGENTEETAANTNAVEGIQDKMEQIEDVVLEVCDQLDETDVVAEVQIVTDEAAARESQEVGTIEEINKTLVEEEFLEKPEEAVIEINESS